MKTSSKKSKGRRLQNFVRDNLLDAFQSLEEDDIKVAIMGESGEDIKLSPAARKKIPYSFECKNTERLQIWQAIEQAEGNANDRVPVVVFKRNRSKTYLTIEFNNFVNMIREKNDNT
tara:strand:- start:9194 stop:9544 length:351 start_codon:yes stop_codon:yes gene_type:complete